jgi:lipoate-protein ligase A
MAGDWIIEHSHGDAGAFHRRTPPPIRAATFHTVDRSTLVLGSAQSDTTVDAVVARALGVDVVQRRSGGGAVLLVPDEFVWLDLVIPAADPLWVADVGRAMVWVGAMWAAALGSLGVRGSVHEGGLVSNEWSRQVCFAGVGTGEVMAGRSKLIGISQRRTRESARFQTMCHIRWRPELVAALVSPPRPTASDLVAAVAPVAFRADVIHQALIDALPR